MLKKILLFSLLALLLLFAYLWLNQERWLAQFNAERAAEFERFHRSGLEFGREHDQQACLDKALSDFNTECSGFSCTVRYGQFLRACWQNAAASADFCNGVPPYRDKPSEEDKNWARETCWGQDIRGEGCRLLLRQQQQLCSGQTPSDIEN